MKDTFILKEDFPNTLVKELTHGLYEIYWKSGGSSLASVGYDTVGNNWYAPCNWLNGSTTDWTMVKAYKLLLANDYSKKTKGIKSTHIKQILP